MASSINQTPAAKYERFERSPHIAKTFHLGAFLDENVHRRVHPPQTTVHPLCPAERRFGAFPHHDQQIEIAAFVWFSLRVRTEQPYLLRLKLSRETAAHFIEQLMIDSLHGHNPLQRSQPCKTAVSPCDITRPTSYLTFWR